MGQEIQQLDPTTVERIAAGEVVERPASVVKELVENSLDADASRVRVTVESGGKDGIKVSDDGVGMSEDAVRQAVREHTTSKIRDIEDLEGGVATLGFRGEALHAIGAVSRTTITTRPRGGDTGTELRLEGGEVESVRPAGCPEGTTIEIDDLFYNVPARRKYLKQDSTEFAHVNTVVTAYALANPDVAVALEHDGRETFATTGQGNRKETVMSVYGRDVAQSMIEVNADDLPDGPLNGVSGLVSHPETNRAGREYLSTYVNGRFVTANTVRDAVVEAYGGQLAPDRYPFAVLFLELPAGQVDVNVHPRKLEVRFADAEGVAEQISSAVESALLREGLLRSAAPRGRSAHDQTEITPESVESADADSDAKSGGSKIETGPTADESERVATADDAGRDTLASDSTTDDPDTTQPSDERVKNADSHEGKNISSSTETDGSVSSRTRPDSQRDPSPTGGESETTADGFESNDRDEENSFNGRKKRSDGSMSLSATEQERFGESDPTEREFDSLPSMRLLGQFKETYLVAEGPDGLLLIDQHAADERINYEALRERFLGDTPTQALAEPVRVDLTAREAELFETMADALAQVGFQAQRTGDRAVEVTTVPALLADAGGPEFVRDVLSSFAEGAGAGAATVDAAVDELLADLACYPSVTANTELTDGSILSLLDALDDCENPYACPHGRPVVIELDTDEIADRFERDYPGHG